MLSICAILHHYMYECLKPFEEWPGNSTRPLPVTANDGDLMDSLKCCDRQRANLWLKPLRSGYRNPFCVRGNLNNHAHFSILISNPSSMEEGQNQARGVSLAKLGFRCRRLNSFQNIARCAIQNGQWRHVFYFDRKKRK